MVSGDNTTVTLTGGGPWGFRLTGGGSLPLQIAKIRKKSQAHAKGLQEGDAVVSINGTPVHDRTHDQAVDLIDAAGETLTLQIYRGDSDDLGRLLAHKKVQSLIRPGQDDGGDLAALTTSSNVITSSNSTVQDDGKTRREVQEKVFVIAEGDIQSSSFVRREQTVTTSATTSAGDVNGNVGVLGGGGGFTATVALSADVSMPQSLSPGPAISLSPQPGFQSPRQQSSSPLRPLSPAQPGKFIPSVAPTTFSPRPGSSPQPAFSSSSPQPAFQPMQQQQQQQQQSTPAPYRAPRPTFKAVAPKSGPPVPPKPLFHPQYNAQAPVQAPQPPAFSPNKFQVSATAMYAPQQAYSPGGGSQPYSPVSQPYSPRGGSSAPFSPGGAYSPVGQPQQVSFVRQTSVKQLFTPGGGNQQQQQQQQQMQSPMSPMSPQQPFSPLSPSNNMMGPMFHVRNNYGDSSKNPSWTANMWLPDQDPSGGGGAGQQRQQRQQQPQQQQQRGGGGGGGGSNNENIEIPKKMSVKEKQQMLLAHAARTKHSLLARSADPTFDAPPEEVQRARATGGGHPQHGGGGGHHHAHHKLHVFGPPVEMTPEGPHDDLGLVRTYSGQSDDSGSSSAIRRQKKMYSDSAFYADPVKNYPTIEDQMKLCRIISTSLTSAANKRARGARMFAKRQKRAPKWVHESQYEWSSSAGDVGNLDDLDSELLAEEGGQKQLLMFRIPNLRQRVGSPEKNTKMSMKKDEFERLRLQSQKCDHKTISPGACFDIVADLRASKGKAGRMFEKRKNRADKYVTDESNAKQAGPKQTRLDDLLNTPLKSRQSPWQAAQSDQGMDAAFEHISERERMQRLNRILKYNPTQGPPKPQMTPSPALPPMEPLPLVGPRTNLRGGQLNVLQGKNFNRAARGWGGAGGGGGNDDNRQERASSAGPATHHMQPPQAMSQDYADYSQDYSQQSAPRSQQPKVHFGDYNPRPRAWQPPSQQQQQQQQGGDYHSCPPSMSASWNSSDFAQDSQGYHNGYDDVGACDL